jgi:hypothetical protein
MKCFFDIHEEMFWFKAYADMVKVAITTMRKYTNALEPYVVYDGWPNAFTDWLQAHQVGVIYRRSLLYPKLIQLDRETKDKAYLNHGPGVLLKLDLTNICKELGWKDEQIIFFDCDIIFTGDPTSLWTSLEGKCFAVAAEDDPNVPERLNTGVMLIDVEALHKHSDALRRYTSENLPELIQISWDQHAYKMYFKELGWAVLPAELNWKPYWGINPNARIVHFHGPKPFLRSEIAAGRVHEAHKPLVSGAFYHYCDLYDKALVEANA